MCGSLEIRGHAEQGLSGQPPEPVAASTGGVCVLGPPLTRKVHIDAIDVWALRSALTKETGQANGQAIGGMGGGGRAWVYPYLSIFIGMKLSLSSFATSSFSKLSLSITCHHSSSHFTDTVTVGRAGNYMAPYKVSQELSHE